MARIRSIHPGFWTDEATLEMSIQAQLFMIGLWNEADDGGAFAWKPRQLKARLMPMHNVDPEETLSELVQIGVIRKYESGGQDIGAIRNFGKWQSPKKPSRKFPMPGEIMQFCATENIPGTGKEQVEKTSEKSSKEPQGREESSEPVPHQFGTSSEPVPLGRGEEEEEEEDILSHFVREARANDPDEIPEKNPKPSKRGHRLPPDGTPSPEPKKSTASKPKSSQPKIELPDWVPVEAWDGWLKMRRNELKKTAGHRAQELSVKKLATLRDQGHDPGAVLDQSTMMGWQGLYPVKADRTGPLAHNVTPFPRPMSRDEENRRASMDFLKGLANG